eukprot:193374-Rhodomonas_salina.3
MSVPVQPRQIGIPAAPATFPRAAAWYQHSLYQYRTQLMPGIPLCSLVADDRSQYRTSPGEGISDSLLQYRTPPRRGKKPWRHSTRSSTCSRCAASRCARSSLCARDIRT